MFTQPPLKIVTFCDLGNQGRLGNQLFQIAAVASHAEHWGLQYAFPDWKYNSQIAKPLPFLPTGYKPNYQYYEESFTYTQCWKFVELNERDPDINADILNISGYFQSEKYFKPELVRRLFAPSSGVCLNLQHAIDHSPLSHIGTAVNNTCAVHLRRGDYVDNPFYAQLWENGYYEKAMEHIREAVGPSVKFYVFTDDAEFAKQQPLFQNFETFIIEPSSNDYEDLILMSYCRHRIIANSSYSWWGAYLSRHQSDGIMVYPQQWFGPAAPKTHDTKDLYSYFESRRNSISF